MLSEWSPAGPGIDCPCGDEATHFVEFDEDGTRERHNLCRKCAVAIVAERE